MLPGIDQRQSLSLWKHLIPDTAKNPDMRMGGLGCLLPRVMAMLLLSLLPLLPLPLPALAPLPPLPDSSSELPDPEPSMAPPPLCATACCTSRHVASSATLTAVLLPMAVRLQDGYRRASVAGLWGRRRAGDILPSKPGVYWRHARLDVASHMKQIADFLGSNIPVTRQLQTVGVTAGAKDA